VLPVGVGPGVGVVLLVGVGPAVPVIVAVGAMVPVACGDELLLSHPVESRLRIPRSKPNITHVLFMVVGQRPDNLREIRFGVPEAV